MNPEFLPFFELAGSPCRIEDDALVGTDRRIPIRNGIPRFTPDLSYSSGNFSRLRERHSALQLDSKNGTSDRRDTILTRTCWPTDYFRGKTVLECGCGAGPDTEVLCSLGARVLAVDLAGVDIARRNLGETRNVQFLQASIDDLPLRRGSFDIVFCHRVIQHTPDPEAVLDHILQFVRPEGAVFVHSYAHTLQQLWRWKYWLRPLTRRMDPARLYAMIERAAPLLYKVTLWVNRTRWGRRFAHVFIPFANYRHLPQFRAMGDIAMREYAIHDTFDALSPRYDDPIAPEAMAAIAARHLRSPFEVYRGSMITLLRSTLAPEVSAISLPG